MISSAIPYHHEFHNPIDFNQRFRKRPFDFDVEETTGQINNAYKKIKSTSSVDSLLPQQTIRSSFPLNHSPSFDSSKYTYVKDKGDVETNLVSDNSRIVDLSTGEYLEPIPSVEQLQKDRKPKRPIELDEDQDRLSNMNIVDEELLHSHKRIRISKEHMCNFIEEEEIDPEVCEPIVDVESRIEHFNKPNFTEKPQSSQPLSIYVHGKGSPNIKFTAPYQNAMARYMRSQFQHLNNEEYGNEGKQIVLYNPRKDYFKESFVKNNHGTEDENDRIFEIFEDGQNEDQMDVD